jgi:hypothetical protein
MTKETRSSLLVSSPRTFSHWWTFVPVLPAGPDTHEYKVLKRQWADHTMNTLRPHNGEYVPGNRGVYVETREDHITTCLFQIWASLPGYAWAASLLDLWNVPHGVIKNVRWSYSWAQKEDPTKGSYLHCDIVVNWMDEGGPGVLVIEAKRPGGHTNGLRD